MTPAATTESFCSRSAPTSRQQSPCSLPSIHSLNPLWKFLGHDRSKSSALVLQVPPLFIATGSWVGRESASCLHRSMPSYATLQTSDHFDTTMRPGWCVVIAEARCRSRCTQIPDQASLQLLNFRTRPPESQQGLLR